MYGTIAKNKRESKTYCQSLKGVKKTSKRKLEGEKIIVTIDKSKPVFLSHLSSLNNGYSRAHGYQYNYQNTETTS